MALAATIGSYEQLLNVKVIVTMDSERPSDPLVSVTVVNLQAVNRIAEQVRQVPAQFLNT